MRKGLRDMLCSRAPVGRGVVWTMNVRESLRVGY